MELSNLRLVIFKYLQLMKKESSNEESLSGVGGIKYQKAIKEISKLIAINTALRKELKALQEKHEYLQDNYSVLEEKLSNLDFQMDNKPVTHLLIRNNDSKESPDKELENTDSISEYIDTKRKVEEMEAKIAQKDYLIQELQLDLEKKQFENIQLYQKYVQVSKELEESISGAMKEDLQILQKENLKLSSELSNSERYIKSLKNELENYKEIIQKNSNPLQESVTLEIKPELTGFYSEKLKKMEEANRCLKEDNKKKRQVLKREISRLQQVNQLQLKKFYSLVSFIEKQQKFIEGLVNENYAYKSG